MAPGQSTPAPVRAGGSTSENDDDYEYSYVEDRSQPIYSKSMMEMSALWPVRPRLYKMIRVKTPKKRSDAAAAMPPPSASTVDGQGGGRSSQAPTLVGEQDTDLEKKEKGEVTPHRKKKKRRKEREQLPPVTPRQELEGWNDEEGATVEDPDGSHTKKKKKKRRLEDQPSSQIELALDEPGHTSSRKKKKSKHHSSSQVEPEPEAPLEDPPKKKRKRKKSHHAESSQAEPQTSDLIQPSPAEPELPATPSPEPRPLEPLEQSPEIIPNLLSSQIESLEAVQSVDASPKKGKRSRRKRAKSVSREPSEEQVDSAPVASSEWHAKKRKESSDELGDVQMAKKRRMHPPDEADMLPVGMADTGADDGPDIGVESLPPHVSPELPIDSEEGAGSTSQDHDDDDMDEQDLLNAQIFSSQQQLEPDVDGYASYENELSTSGDVVMESTEAGHDPEMSETAPHFDDAEEKVPSVEEQPEQAEDETNNHSDDGEVQDIKRERIGHSRQRAPKRPWTQNAVDPAQDDQNSSRPSPEARAPTRAPERKAPSTKASSTAKKKKLRERMRGGTSEREMAPKEKSTRRRRKTKEKKPVTTEGSRSTQEETALKEVFKDFMATYGLTESAANDLVQENPTQESGRDAKKMKKDFWQRAEDVCPGRDRKSLMSCCRRLFHNKDRGEWSEEQKNQLHDLFEKYDRDFKHIGSIVNRDRMDVRHYYLTVYRCLGKQKKGKWTPEEEEQYLSIVTSMLEEKRKDREADPQNTPSRMIAGADDENLINWEQVSVRMGYTRNEKQCRTKWNSMREKGLVTLGDETPRPPSHKAQLDLDRKTLHLMKQDDIAAFVRAVETSGAKKSKDIPWAKLVDPKFRRKWKRPTLQLLWSRLSKSVPDYETLTVPEIAHYLVEKHMKGDKLDILPDDEANETEEARIIGGLWNTPAATPKRRQARVVSSAVAIDSSDSEQDDDEENTENGRKQDELSDVDADHERDDVASEQDGSTPSVDLSLVTASEEPMLGGDEEINADESDESSPAVDTLD